MKVDSRKTNSVWCTSGGEWCTLSFRGSLTAWRCPHCVCLFQVAHFKEFIPQAFPGGHSMILDAEVLLIDTNTSKPLPFGTLGVHKVRTAQTDWSFVHMKYEVSLFWPGCRHTVSSESRLPGCQSVSLCLRLYLLQRCEPHGEVTCFITFQKHFLSRVFAEQQRSSPAARGSM